MNPGFHVHVGIQKEEIRRTKYHSRPDTTSFAIEHPPFKLDPAIQHLAIESPPSPRASPEAFIAAALCLLFRSHLFRPTHLHPAQASPTHVPLT